MGEPTRHTKDSQYGFPQYPVLGSWNPTTNDGGPDTNEFFEVKNLRMQTPGQYQSRSGYKMYPQELTSSFVRIYSKGEYQIGGVMLDATLYFDETQSKVFALFFNKTTQAFLAAQEIQTVVTEPEMVCSAQYESFFLVSLVSGNQSGTWALYPTDETNLAGTWELVPMGKSLANTPTVQTPSFVATMNGDLLVRQSKNVNQNQTFEYQPGEKEPPIIRLPIEAQYWLTSDAGFTGWNVKLKRFEWSDNDPIDYVTGYEIPTESTTHLQENNWGYRAVFVQEITNAKGEKITFRSQASVDWWVPNMMYASAFMGYNGTNSTAGLFMDWLLGTAFPGEWTDSPSDYPLDARGTGGTGASATGFPKFTGATDVQQLLDLSSIFRKYFHSIANVRDNGGTGDPYFYTALYLGWMILTDSHFLGVAPYKIPASAYEVKEAPMTVLKWTDFNTHPDFPSNVTKIEIYRTAYNKSTKEFADNNPLFQPHLYGYIGAIEPDGTLTDDVADTAIVWGKTPEAYDGYLAGQFSGKVLRTYNDKIALGNIVSDYWAFQPSAVQQAIAANLTSDGASAYTATSNINTEYVFFYQYEDELGNVSDIQEVPVNTTDAGARTSSVFFRIPAGYSSFVTKVNIIMRKTSLTEYYLVAKVSVGTQFYRYSFAHAFGPSDIYPYLTKNIKRTVEPGGILAGVGSSIMDFPLTNIEIASKVWGITAMEVIIGRLWVWTERTLYLTVLNFNDPQAEEETVHAGNIGFNTLAKSNKIVFFLSAHGLYFAESSGIVPFPGRIQNELLAYLNEHIEGSPDLVNASRASLAWLGQRDELWVHMPSSVDIGGNLPERTFIYKLWGGSVQNMVNYEFQLVNSLDATIAPITTPVVLYGHTDGTLFSSYMDTSHDQLLVMDNDAPDEEWPGETVLEKRLPLGNPNQKKRLRAVTIRSDGKCVRWIVTGRPYPPGASVPANTPDYYGDIYKGGAAGGVTKYQFVDANQSAGQPQLWKHRVNGNTVESTAYIPAIRFVTQPDGDGDNSVTYYSLGVYLSIYDHP